ncbi:hypothetical protein [Pseudodesulfovibrio methanolicus]|uniref:Uncharacterized protein n=1 Tax=Pseudodesulfovibrio methanolicus TaxID=3126690 RepID=A0ABZ2ISI5_9BACT
MSLWSTQTLQKRSVDENLISPFNSSNIKHCSYELARGGKYYSTEDQNRIAIWLGGVLFTIIITLMGAIISGIFPKLLDRWLG